MVSTLGQRLRELRGDWMTQNDLATAAGVSVDIVRKLEQGQRHTVSIVTLHKLAGALDVDTGALLSRTTSLPSTEPHSGVVAIRAALTDVSDLLGDAPDDDPIGLPEARRAVTYAWGAYWGGEYDKLGSVLPSTLTQVAATVRDAADGEASEEAHDLAAQLHQVTACTLVHLGQPDAAFLALRRGIDLTSRGSDPLRAAALRCSLSWLLLTQGRFQESERLAVVTAEGIEPSGTVPTSHVSLYGTCVITGATAAGRAGRGKNASQLLGVARDAVARTGNTDRTDYESPFGPSQLVMQTVDVHVVTEEYGAALDTAKRMPRDSGLPLAARCRHLADVAQAQTRMGHDGAALDTLLTMEHLSPAWTRFQTLPREVTRELVEHERRVRTPRLRELAGRLGVSTG